MNSIPQIQNEEKHLGQLAAQRQLYSEAKHTLGWQMILVIPGAVFLSYVIALRPAYQEWAALFVVLITLFDVLVLEPRQKRLTEKAAKIQQIFDSEVFGWNDTSSEIEEITDAAMRHQKKDPGYSRLKDWYPASVGTIPLIPARIICQRSNIWWDSKLRRRYTTVLLSSLSVLVAAVSFIGFNSGITFQRFVFFIFAPLLPLLIWGIREGRKHLESAGRLDRLMDRALELWQQACQKSTTDTRLEEKSRALQLEIYDHRRSAPFIFDWLYGLFRKKSEAHMSKTAEQLVEEY